MGNSNRLECYIDASFSIHPDGKGHTGMVIMWGGACIMITCRKQKICTKNSTESELVGVSDSLDEVEWTQDFIESLGHKLSTPILFQDNQSTITIVLEKTTRRLRTKHMTARRAVLHEAIVTNKEAEVVYKYTKWMLADPFTKPLEGQGYQLLMNVIMGWMTVETVQKLIGPKVVGVRCNKRNTSTVKVPKLTSTVRFQKPDHVL